MKATTSPLTTTGPVQPVDEEALLNRPLEEVPTHPPTATDCMARRTSDGVFVGYCRAWPGRGTDHVGEGRCKHHGGAAANAGRENGNYRSGAYSAHFRADLTPAELEAAADLVAQLEVPTPEAAEIPEIVAEALLKYKRSDDVRFLREARQWLAEFNLVPNPDTVGHITVEDRR